MDFSIRIKNVTRTDAGKYRCEVSTPSEKGQSLEEDTITLEVLGDVPVSVRLLCPHPPSHHPALGAARHLGAQAAESQRPPAPPFLQSLPPFSLHLVGSWNVTVTNSLSQNLSLFKIEVSLNGPTLYVGAFPPRVYFAIAFSICSVSPTT